MTDNKKPQIGDTRSGAFTLASPKDISLLCKQVNYRHKVKLVKK